MRAAFIKTLEELAAKDKNLIFITGDLGYNVIENFQKKFPKQFINAGVAEQNMTGMAAGLALSGKTVFTYSIANFPSLRPLEQVRNDICYHNANVKIISIGAGFMYGGLGATHHATEDIAIMRALPNMVVISPADGIDTELATRAIVEWNGPCYLRLGKDHKIYKKPYAFKIGKAHTVRNGKDITLISTGNILKEALEASDELKKQKINARVVNMHTVKPIDRTTIRKAAQETKGIVTIEEHSVIGGLGSAVAETLADLGFQTKLKIIGIPDTFSKYVGDEEFLKGKYGLTVKNILAQSKNL